MAGFFWGIFFVGIGVLVVYYSSRLERVFGRLSWAEKYVGGTRQGYVLIGIGMMLLGFLLIFGVVELGDSKLGIGD